MLFFYFSLFFSLIIQAHTVSDIHILKLFHVLPKSVPFLYLYELSLNYYLAFSFWYLFLTHFMLFVNFIFIYTVLNLFCLVPCFFSWNFFNKKEKLSFVCIYEKIAGNMNFGNFCTYFICVIRFVYNIIFGHFVIVGYFYY